MAEETVTRDALEAEWDKSNPIPIEDLEADEGTESEEHPTEPVEEPVEGEQAAKATEGDVPEEPEDNRERSQLGRKVKLLEEQLARMNEFANQAQALLQQKQQQEEEYIDEDAPVTIKDVERILATREQQRVRAQQEYDYNYGSQLVHLGVDLDEAEHAEIINTVGTLKNPSKTGNPTLDAQMDFMAAQNAVLRTRIKNSQKPSNPLNKNKETEPENLGGGVETSTKLKPRNMPKLPPDAAAFVKRNGWDAEKVHTILSGDIPLGLVNPKDR